MKSSKFFVVFMLMLIFSASVYAVEDSEKVVFSSQAASADVNIKTDGELYFESNDASFRILAVGSVLSKNGDVKINEGFVKNEKAAELIFNGDGAGFMFEKSSDGITFVKSGDFADIANLKNERDLKNASVTILNEDKLTFVLSEKPESVRYFALSNPDRMVFDFIGIKGKIRKAGGLNVRTANHPAGYRVVIDGRTPEYFTMSKKGKVFEFNPNGHKMFAMFSQEMKSEKIAEKKDEPKKVSNTVKSEVFSVLLSGNDSEKVKILASGNISLEKNITDKNKIEFLIPGATIAKEKEQLIDASSVGGIVKELAVFNTDKGVKVVASTSADYTLDIHDQGSIKELVFVPAKEETVPVEKTGVAGYSENVASTTSAVIAQSEDLNGEAQVVDTPDTGVTGDGMNTIGGGDKKYTGRKISLDFKDADILDILRLMSEISKLNIIAGDDVKGTVTVRLMDIPWDEALDVVLRSKSLGKERFGNIIRVATLKTLQGEKESELAKKKAQVKLEPLKVRLISVNYAMADELVGKVKELLTERGSVTTDTRTNIIVVKDIAEVLDKSEKLIEFLDTQTPQVLIEARIIESSAQSSKGLGIEWDASGVADVAHNNPVGATFPYNMGMNGAVSVPVAGDASGTLGMSFGSIGNIVNLNLMLSVMESEGKIKIVSSPKVATLDNKEATIKQGTKIPISTSQDSGGTGSVTYTTEYIDATLELKTTPHITADGSILMKLEIKKEEPDWSRVDRFGHPAMTTKEATTEVLVKSGDTIVIGGVYSNKVAKNTSGVPFLSKIPVLGFLFRSELNQTERSELLIFITPRIMNRVKSFMPLMESEEE